jgi:predicted transposase YbfD/YdcC
MKFIDQKAEHLYLSVIRGSVPKEQVQILCSGELETPFGQIKASIIGASHFFELIDKKGKTIFSEVLACQKLDVKEMLFYDKVTKANNYSQKFENLSYQFKAEQIQWDADIMSHYKKLCDKSTHHAGFALRFQFPNKNALLKSSLPKNKSSKTNPKNKDKNQQQAITMLTVLEYKNKIRVNSLHAYPNEKQLVISQTTLKIV